MYDRDPVENPLQVAIGLLVLALTYFLVPRYRDFAIPGVALVFALTAWGLRIRKRRASETWAFTTGTIESVSIRNDPDSWLAGPWIAEIAYSYQAHGGWYSGFEEKHYYRERSADKNAALKGTKVAVRYDPQSPGDSVLDAPQLR